MKTVRLHNNIVAEIIPDYALPVEQWYGTDFAAQCVDAPDNVQQRWVYDAASGTFSEPPEPIPEPAPVDPQDDTDTMLVDHEYRLTLLELGVTEGGI